MIENLLTWILILGSFCVLEFGSIIFLAFSYLKFIKKEKEKEIESAVTPVWEYPLFQESTAGNIKIPDSHTRVYIPEVDSSNVHIQDTEIESKSSLENLRKIKKPGKNNG